MISKEVLENTQKKLIKINMLVVSGFLILLCIFTYFYFSYNNDTNINREMQEELNSIIHQLEQLDSRYGILYSDPKNMVYIYVDGTLIINPKNNPYFENEVPDYQQ